MLFQQRADPFKERISQSFSLKLPMSKFSDFHNYINQKSKPASQNTVVFRVQIWAIFTRHKNFKIAYESNGLGAKTMESQAQFCLKLVLGP